MSQNQSGLSPSTITAIRQARKFLEPRESSDILKATLRYLAKWHAQVLTNTFRAQRHDRAGRLVQGHAL